MRCREVALVKVVVTCRLVGRCLQRKELGWYSTLVTVVVTCRLAGRCEQRQELGWYFTLVTVVTCRLF